MMIQRVGALTGDVGVSNTTTIKNPQPQKPSFEGLGVNKTGKTMKALAAAAILGMAAVGMSSCVQPTDPTVIEEPTEKEPEETTPVDDEETKPVVDDDETKPVVDDDDTKPTTGDEETKPVVDDEETPVIDDEETKPIVDDEETPIIDDEETKPVEETPFIVNDTISLALAKTETYKVLSEVGFENITGVDVPVEAGKYQPKTGEIVELYYNDLGMYPTTYTLNRELSKDGHLVYDYSRYKEIFGLDTLKTSIGDDEFSCDAKNKTLTHYTPDDNPNHYQYSYIKINDDGSFTYGRYKNTPNDGSLLLDDPMSFDKSENSVGLYMDIAFKLAK